MFLLSPSLGGISISTSMSLYTILFHRINDTVFDRFGSLLAHRTQRRNTAVIIRYASILLRIRTQGRVVYKIISITVCTACTLSHIHTHAHGTFRHVMTF